jgi:hypothetical protein
MRTLTFSSSGGECRDPTGKVGECNSHSQTWETWSPPGFPKIQKTIWGGQISLHWCVLYINGKVLKCRCPKWPRMGHLDICSPSYGQKKSWESNYQFDSRPLKVGNRPLSDVAWRSVTWCWKALDESYNFGLDLVSIRVQGKELWASKVLKL